MTVRHALVTLLVLPVAISPAILTPADSTTAAPPATTPAAVPDTALHALDAGRFWHASRILHEYLATSADSTPAALMLTARADAGWGGWAAVESLLDGRDWLDTAADGAGWRLLGRARLVTGDADGAARAFARYLDVADAASERDRGIAEYRRALALRRAEADSAALTAFDRAARALPLAAAPITEQAVDVAASMGDTAGVARRLASLDPELVQRIGWRSRVRALREARDLDGAARVAVSAERDAGRDADRARAAFEVGRIELERGDTTAARAAFRRVVDAAPGAITAVDAARRLSDLPGLSAEDRLAIGRLYLRHGNAERAAVGIGAYLDAGLGSPAERARLRLDRGRSMLNAGRNSSAEQTLLELADDDDVSESVASEALFLAGRAQYRRGARDAGITTFRRTAERFPDSRPAVEALFLAADLDHDAERLDRARRTYRQVVDLRPDAYEAGLARMRLAGMALLEADTERALEIFESYRSDYPNGRRHGQATYWAARVYHEIGDTARAIARLNELRDADPFSYYGIRAADRLGASLRDLPLASSPRTDPETTARIADALETVDLLRTLELDRAASREIDRLVRRFRSDRGAAYGLAEALNERGLTTEGIQLGWSIHEREGEWNPRLLRIVYPFPYEAAIRAEADERSLDPFLVAGLIRRESMFLSHARSPAGAVGLMQIMPYTGRALARGARIDDFRVGMLERPDLNLHLGTGYLAELLDRFEERHPAVLAAYNAGPHRVRDWSELPEWDDLELFTERIPYRETRNYVKIVQQHHRIYAALYGHADDASATRPANDR